MNDHMQFEPAGSPFVPKDKVCACRVPLLTPHDNLLTGWSETSCLRCRRHYGWGVHWARSHNYRHRSAMQDVLTKVPKARENTWKRFNEGIPE